MTLFYEQFEFPACATRHAPRLEKLSWCLEHDGFVRTYRNIVFICTYLVRMIQTAVALPPITRSSTWYRTILKVAGEVEERVYRVRQQRRVKVRLFMA